MLEWRQPSQELSREMSADNGDDKFDIYWQTLHKVVLPVSREELEAHEDIRFLSLVF